MECLEKIPALAAAEQHEEALEKLAFVVDLIQEKERIGCYPDLLENLASDALQLCAATSAVEEKTTGWARQAVAALEVMGGRGDPETKDRMEMFRRFTKEAPTALTLATGFAEIQRKATDRKMKPAKCAAGKESAEHSKDDEDERRAKAEKEKARIRAILDEHAQKEEAEKKKEAVS